MVINEATNAECGDLLKGKNPTNLVVHVKAKHRKAFKQYEATYLIYETEKENKRKTATASKTSLVQNKVVLVQSTISEVS